jgi:hypothetical protein
VTEEVTKSSTVITTSSVVTEQFTVTAAGNEQLLAALAGCNEIVVTSTEVQAVSGSREEVIVSSENVQLQILDEEEKKEVETEKSAEAEAPAEVEEKKDSGIIEPPAEAIDVQVSVL